MSKSHKEASSYKGAIPQGNDVYRGTQVNANTIHDEDVKEYLQLAIETLIYIRLGNKHHKTLHILASVRKTANMEPHENQIHADYASDKQHQDNIMYVTFEVFQPKQ